MTAVNLRGALIPVPTPFDPETGDIDTVAFRANVRSWMEEPLRGVVTSGSTGESVLLADDERIELVTAARDVVPDDRVLVAGVGLESTRGTVALCAAAADAGADAVLIQPPAYYRGQMTPGVVRDHYGAVADASPVPVIVYQVPLRMSTIDLPAGLVGELSAHPDIVGIKDSRGDLAVLGELLDRVEDDFQVLVGNGALYYASLEVGAVGGVMAAALLAPGAYPEIRAAFDDGRTAEAGRIQDRVAPAHREIVGAMGVPGIKAALEILGLHGGAPRPPLPPVGDDERRAIRETLEAAGLVPAAA